MTINNSNRWQKALMAMAITGALVSPAAFAASKGSAMKAPAGHIKVAPSEKGEKMGQPKAPSQDGETKKLAKKSNRKHKRSSTAQRHQPKKRHQARGPKPHTGKRKSRA